jgi:hypothetical protein
MASKWPRWVIGAIVLAGTAVRSHAAPVDLVPPRPGTRILAVTTLSGGGALAGNCITPIVQSVRTDPQKATAAARRSVGWLAADSPLLGERRVVDANGNVIRFTLDRASMDRIEPTDENGNGRPDLMEAAAAGVARAAHLLGGQLELANPGPVEIVLARLGSGVDGLTGATSGRSARAQIWLDPTSRGGAAAIRRAAEHQYAHVVAAQTGLDAAWGESLAAWTALKLESGPDERAATSINHRLSDAGAGLVVDDLDLAAGNAVWFAFLEESDGPAAVKTAVEELGRGGSDQAALDRALRRVTGQPLNEALRDFQLWSLLTGPRDDRRHFSFASGLAAPTFAATVDALPALSVQADPEIGAMGSAAILLRLSEKSGGLNVRFEGDASGRWASDLLLVHVDGSMRRVPLAIDNDQAAELTVPLQDVSEAILLVRNLEPEGHAARRYTWGARLEAGYPAEIDDLHAEPSGSKGARVSWQTGSESGILGFNILRSRGDDGRPVRINPVWIPAVGGDGMQAAYSFLDASTEPGVAYSYRVEAVTPEGLTSRSDAVVLSPAP